MIDRHNVCRLDSVLENAFTVNAPTGSAEFAAEYRDWWSGGSFNGTVKSWGAPATRVVVPNNRAGADGYVANMDAAWKKYWKDMSAKYAVSEGMPGLTCTHPCASALICTRLMDSS